MFKQYPKFLQLLLILVLLISCSKKNYSSLPIYQFKSNNGLPQYENLYYWAAHPWKKNTSDSVPKDLKINYQKDSLADVFYIYPTTFIDMKDSRWNAPIDDPEINAKTDYSAILYQASVFNEKCRIFAPRYRQANLKAFYSDNQKNAISAFDTAYEDVRKSFIYYLEHFNQGRPIIIASHSQGTVHAAKIIKEFFEGKDLQKKLICAYLIGMPIKEDYYKSIKPCNNESSTGCVISWRTYKSGYIDTNYIAKENFKTIVVNPLNWSLSAAYQSTDKNKGGILKNFNKLKKGVVDAQIHGNILWTCKPKFFGNFLIKTKNYHIGDYNLFYENIRENISTRINKYLSDQSNN